MNSVKYILFVCFLSIIIAGNAQTKREVEETYRDANSYFYFEDYEEALALYLQVYSHEPDNNNLCYKIGFCYLNIPGSKDKAISFLQKAIQNTARNYNEESVIETKAPVDAIFYLGNAYFVNNQIDKALKEYNKFIDITKGRGQWNFDYLDHQISTAKNSLTIQKTPVNFIEVNLGDKINDRFANFNPVISGNGKALAYTTKRKFYQAIFVSNLNSNGEWSTPKNITLDLQVDGNCSTLSLSYDGTELYLFKDDNHDGNIYVSHLISGKWSPMMKLNKNINSESYETHACVSSDGKYLYFTSNRKGGYGDLDIYRSERSFDDNWGIPKNLGPVINTEFNENTPFLSNDGNLLYFSSEGHNNMGGYDIFVSQLNTKGEWSTPINLGYPINTTDDNLFYQPVNDGSTGLIALFDPDSYGDQDIYEVELFVPRFMRNIVSSTSFSERLSDKMYKKIVVDTLSNKGVALIDITDSDFPITIDPQKRYKLFFEGKGFDIREKTIPTEKITVKTDKVQANELNLASNTELEKHEEDTVTTPIQERIHLLKQFSDTNNRQNTTVNRNFPDSQIKEENTVDYSQAVTADNNYLSEILLMLSPSNTQALLTRILKKDWEFQSDRFNEKIIEFSQSFETYDERNAMVITFSNFADKLFGLNAETGSHKKSKNISKSNTHNSFYYFYNQLINLSSTKLGKQLAEVLVNNPQIESITDLIQTYKQTNRKGYDENLPELLRILANSTISSYNNMSDDEKFNLYNGLTQQASGKASNWWIYLIGLVVTLMVLGVTIYYKKQRN